MSFDKGTVREQNGLVQVMDLSGMGNHAMGQGVKLTESGHTGGGLASSKSELRIPGNLINKAPQYTFCTWAFRPDGDDVLTPIREFRNGVIFAIRVAGNTVAVENWNQNAPGDWSRVRTVDCCPRNEWFFLAVRFVQTSIRSGKLRITVNDRSLDLDSWGPYKLGSSDDNYILIGNIEERSSRLDDMMLFARALSDDEIKSLYEAGLEKQGASNEQ